jgi:MFS family permease
MNAQASNTTTNLMQDLRALPGQYWILFGGTLVNRMGSFVIPFLAIYLRQMGYDAGTTSVTLAAYGAGALVAGVAGGYLADRIGRKPTMLISCAGAAASMLVLSQARALPGLVSMTFMTGLLTAMYGPPAGALIADLVPPRLRVRAFSCQRLAINLGFAIGMALAGFLATRSFLALFIGDAGTTLVLGLILFFGLKKRPPVVAKSGAGWGPALRHMRRNTAFKLATVASFLMSAVFWQMSSSYGLQATQGAGLDERAYGLLMGFNGLMIVCFELSITNYSRRFSPVKVMALGYLLIGLGMAANALGANLPVLVTSMAIFTLGEMIAMPVGSGYMAALAPDEMRGRYQGVMSMTFSAATMLGPSLGIQLYEASPLALWLGLLTLSCIAAGLVLATGRWLDRG